MYSLTDYEYNLPNERVAQKPSPVRDRSKLLFLNRKTGGLSHHLFYELGDLIFPGDVLVINDAEVIPGRLIGRKATGGKTEVLILDYVDTNGSRTTGEDPAFECLIKASKTPKPGTWIFFDEGLKGEVVDCRDGVHTVRFIYSGNFETLLYRIGKVPLPPYIKRKNNDIDCNDRTSYQTVYASRKGAVAAPTAGLHFTGALMDRLKEDGFSMAAITLHVGYGTFLPVKTPDIRDHTIHSERYFISEETADIINRAKTDNRRIIAVGTTCVRTLEYASDKSGAVRFGGGKCDLFIYPGYRFNVVDGMITNFHLPRSTLLMLVSAFAGREKILKAYDEAIRSGYRFYSYGDAMLIA
jgi:S-adenosylmethionine:tRNA ribosyltransferase-isomerase